LGKTILEKRDCSETSPERRGNLEEEKTGKKLISAIIPLQGGKAERKKEEEGKEVLKSKDIVGLEKKHIRRGGKQPLGGARKR